MTNTFTNQVSSSLFISLFLFLSEVDKAALLCDEYGRLFRGKVQFSLKNVQVVGSVGKQSIGNFEHCRYPG